MNQRIALAPGPGGRADHTGWRLERRFRHALHRGSHEINPDRQRHATAGFSFAERFGLIEPDPRDADQGGVESGKPGVKTIVGGAGFSGKVVAPELHGRGGRARAHDVPQECRHHEGVARVDGLFGVLARDCRRFLEDDLPFVVDNFFDEVRLDAEATVGKHRVRGSHLHRVGLASAEREGQVRRVLLRVKAEFGDVILRVAGPDGAQHADRDHIF